MGLQAFHQNEKEKSFPRRAPPPRPLSFFFFLFFAGRPRSELIPPRVDFNLNRSSLSVRCIRGVINTNINVESTRERYIEYFLRRGSFEYKNRIVNLINYTHCSRLRMFTQLRVWKYVECMYTICKIYDAIPSCRLW